MKFPPNFNPHPTKTINNKPGTKNQKQKTRNQEPKTKNKKQKTRNQEPKTRNKKQHTHENIFLNNKIFP